MEFYHVMNIFQRRAWRLSLPCPIIPSVTHEIKKDTESAPVSKIEEMKIKGTEI